MTREEFISQMKNAGAIFAPAVSDRSLELVQGALQQMRAAVMPSAMIEFYREAAGGIILGDAHIFGPEDFSRGAYSVPSIVKTNRELAIIPALRGKTVFGRNGLFWFSFDAFGNFQMLDLLSAAPLRKYTDCYKVMTDCLIVGRI
jgi:hypothetical protein